MSKVKERESAAKKVYMEFWASYQDGDLEAFASTLDPDFKMIGTSESELANSKEDGISFFKSQMEEVLGKAEMRNREIELMPIDKLFLVTEHCDIYVLIESEWTFYSKIRISTLLRESGTGWKVLQQHGSLPDMRVQEGETMALDKIAKENLELRDAIKRRTTELENKSKELEIEAALERVRAVAMGMKTPDDMLQVCRIIASQLDILGVKHIRNVQTAIIESKEEIYLCYQFFPSYDQDIIERTEYPKNPVEQEMANRMLAARDSHFLGGLSGEELDDFRLHRKEQKYISDPHLDEAEECGYCFLSIGEGGLGLTLYRPLDEHSLALFKRFHQVFSLAYQRFRDIQKAEAQAREAQIEATLEKVRSRSLAMHKSDELNEVVSIVFEKLKELQIPATAVGIGIAIEGSKDLDSFVCGQNEDGLVITNYRLPYFDNPVPKDLNHALNEQLDFFVGHYTKAEKDAFYNYVIEHTAEFKHLPEDILRMIFDSTTYSITSVAVKNAVFNINDFEGKVLAPSEIEIIQRFARVFDQAYTRFLDLQKSEAQAREAQIEASLERVRSQAMAMRHSDDLVNCTRIVFDELENLNLSIERSGIGIFDGETKDCELWTTVINKDGEKELARGVTSLTVHPLFVSTFDSWLSQTPYSYTLEGKELQDYYDLVSKSEFVLSDEIVEKSTSLPKEYYHYSPFSAGGVYFFSETEPSVEDKQIIRRLAEVFDLTYTRFLDLQKAEAQAREAQIEAALERVRSRSMAMHSSSELGDTALVVFQELNKLGIDSVRGGIALINEPLDQAELWLVTEKDGKAETQILGRARGKDHYFYKNYLEVFRRKEDYFLSELAGKELKGYYQVASQYLNVPIPKKFPEREFYYGFFFNEGAINVIARRALNPDELSIGLRFSKVFGLVYRRFLDLQTAEKQAREAQIEAALERVRSKAMAMHNTGDLANANSVVFDELKLLGIAPLRSGIGLIEAENRQATMYGTVLSEHGNNLQLIGKIYLTNNPVLDSIFDHWTKKQIYSPTLNGQELKEYYDLILASYGDLPKPKFSKNEVQYGYFLPFKHGSFYAWTQDPFSEDELKVIQRFVSVIDLTYNRYFDLKKAEAQAREAQIEAALERIRSRSMAMHKTSELSEVILVLFKQFEHLNLVLDTCYIDIFDVNNQAFNFWIGASTAIYPKQVRLPYFDHPIHQLNKDARNNGVEFYTFDEDKNSKDAFFEYFYPNAQGIDVPEERKQHIAKGKGMTGAAALGKYSGITMFNYQKIIYSEEENDILRRVNKVFQQTYTRFLDLKKAEAQAREAVKQSSLDRVRAEIASMRTAKDLERITPLVWKELGSLGVPFFRCGVMIVNEEKELLDFYLSNPEGKALAALHLDYDNSEITRKGVNHWRKQSTYIEHWTQEQFLAFTKSLLEQGQISNVSTYQGGEKPPTSLTLQFVPFTQGMVYVGSETDLSAEELDLVAALGRSLSVAYARYEDFTRLDMAKAKAENALNDLKAAQEQLVQQEKLASLGQLTAGIAHEIKNPLNFVNNFSDLSRELIEEILEERAKNQESRDESLIDDILEDIKSNLQKVHEHGSRADGIVTSMLQHSRASGSKREPKAFNPMVQEFVNLSYHGMRAGKAPINVKIDLQLDPQVGEVSLISEDFSRVILNLCNNAFDAMRDKFLKTGDGRRETEDGNSYLPKLTVKTSLQKDKVMLSIGDNGGGIPEEIRDKILQPFFTTKKGTEGTGLGLSITHDIIKAHGGKLSVESEINKNTSFIISIPISQSLDGKK